MEARPDLTLFEEALLLALQDEKGTFATGAWLSMAASGAILAELLLAERVRLVGDKKKERVELAARTPTGDDLLDECLEAIATSQKPRSLQHWATKFADLQDLRGRIARRLVARDILRLEESKVLLLFTRKAYPELDPEPERALRERLRSAVLDEEAEIDARTSVLLSLAKGTGLLELVFDRKERKAHKARIEAIVNGEAYGHAIRQLVDATNTAIFVACIMPTIMS